MLIAGVLRGFAATLQWMRLSDSVSDFFTVPCFVELKPISSANSK